MCNMLNLAMLSDVELKCLKRMASSFNIVQQGWSQQGWMLLNVFV